MRPAAPAIGFLALLGILAAPCLPSGVRASEPPRSRAWELAFAEDPDSLVARAERAAVRGDHRKAAGLYERAIPHLPRRRSELRRALAYQYVWGGDLDRAELLFARIHRETGSDFDLRLGSLLVQNWKGNHLRAWDGYADMARRNYSRSEPLVGQAAAQNWAGRRDLALSTLRRARDRDPGNRETDRLEQGIRTSLRPGMGAFYDWSEDSDDYQVNSLWLEGWAFPHPQVQLVPFVQIVGIRRRSTPPIDETWVGGTIAARPLTRLGLWGRLSVLTDPAPGSLDSPFTLSARADWTASDAVRFGVSVERFARVSFRTLPEKITGRAVGAFLELRPDWLTRVTLAGDLARYDDVGPPAPVFEKNERIQLVARVSRQVWAPARVRLGAHGLFLDFDKVQDIGIWNPDEFWAAAATLEWDWGRRGAWSVGGGAEVGPARERGGDVTLYGAWHLRGSRTLGEVSLEFRIGHSEGNVETWTGYDRTYAHAGLRRRF